MKRDYLDHIILIKKCLKGDQRAQKELFDVFSGKMFFVCLRYAKDDAEAEDMLQEGFVRVFSNLESFKGKGSFEGWVRRIFVNTAIKYYHKMRKHNGHASLDIISSERVEPSAVHQMSEKEILMLVRELPEGYRMVFNMYAIEGYSHKEIGEALGIEQSTSRSQLVKARKMLQVKMNKLQRVLI